MLRIGNKEEEQERKRSEAGIIRYIKSSCLWKGSERKIRHIATWSRAGRILRNTQENHVRDSRCEPRVAGRLFQPSEKETLPPGTGLDKCLQTWWAGYQTTGARRWLPGTSWPGGQEYMQQVLKEKYEYRCDGEIGKGSGKHLTILNRIVSYEQETGRVTYEADPRHAEMIIRQLNLQNAKSFTTPAGKKKRSEVLASVGIPPVTAEQTTLYRSLVVGAQFLAQESRPEWSCEKSWRERWKRRMKATWKTWKDWDDTW